MTRRTAPTLAQVAKAAGVSLMAASRAINNQSGVAPEKRQEVLRVAEEMGYAVNRAAQKVSGRQSHIIGVVAQFDSPFTSEVMLGIGNVAHVAGYEILMYSLLDQARLPPRGVVQLLQQFADGVIAVLPFEFEYLKPLFAANVPIVAIEHHTEAPEVTTIIGENYQGARNAVQHLVDLGHRDIAFITGDERLASGRDRRRGYEDTLRLNGLEVRPEWIVEGNYKQDGGIEAANRLLAVTPFPTAIFAANDLTAIGAMVTLQKAGYTIPGDVSIIGFDDIPIATQIYPALTTIRQPLSQMGRAAANTLLVLMANMEPPSPIITMSTELVVRDTTAAPAGLRTTRAKRYGTLRRMVPLRMTGA